MAKKIIKITALSLAGIVGAVILAVVIYVIYVSCQYYRIEDQTAVDTVNGREAALPTDRALSVSTYNIGFGAYTHEFSFFMDSGEMNDGTKTQGTGSKAKDRETVLTNTDGAAAVAAGLEADFMYFQEVDTDSTRSRGVNQLEMLQEKFSAYGSAFASNFHSAFLFYPIFDPHGTVNAGIATFSKFSVTENVRRQFPVDESFPNKYLDLDRCFMATRLAVGDTGKQLVLINQHMSAYDKGGTVRARQLELLNGVLKEERDRGNYVVVGGDFNHVLTDETVTFPSRQKTPEWVAFLDPALLSEGYRIAAGTNAPTCRSTDMPYEKGKNYSAVLDGFIVSDNVTVESVANANTDFIYSDHNPVKMTFRLSGV